MGTENPEPNFPPTCYIQGCEKIAEFENKGEDGCKTYHCKDHTKQTECQKSIIKEL